MHFQFQFARKSLLAALFLLMSTGSGTALEPVTPIDRFSQQTWTVENGLPQNSVSVLLQARNGYLWLVTELGLARFDGYVFKVFDRASYPSFPDAEIRCLFDARSSDPYSNKAGTDLWVGTAEGLVRLQGEKTTLLTKSQGLPSDSIRGIAQSKDDRIWVWTDAGLAFWDAGRFRPATFYGSALDAVGAINSVAAGSDGSLWVGGGHGVAVLRRGIWQRRLASPVPQDDREMKLKAGDSLSSQVTRDADGSVLISTTSGIYLDQDDNVVPVLKKKQFAPEEVRFLGRLKDGSVAIGSSSSVTWVPMGATATRFNNAKLTRFSVQRDLTGDRIQTIYADREGCLWIGTNRGLARIRPLNGEAAVVDSLRPSHPIATDAVDSLLEDREGNMWIGTDASGLHILRDSRFRNVGVSEGLSSDATTAIVQDRRGAVWLGTRDHGLNRIKEGNEDSSHPIQTDLNLSVANGLQSDVILSLASAPNGDLWVGTPDGLDRVHAVSGTARPRVETFTSSDGLADDFIRSLLADKDGSIWIGTRRGLTHMSRGKFTTLTQRDGLGSDLVGAITRAANGDLWIGTLNGLSALHDGVLKTFKSQDGLTSNVITALDAMPDGTVWIGTQSGGLNVWDGQHFRAIHANLPNEIHAILHDDQGHVWFASNKGLTRADVTSLFECGKQTVCDLSPDQLTDYTTADGLRSREMSSNSHPTALKAMNGELWFTSPRGAVTVDPNHFPDTPGSQLVLIEQLYVDDHPADAHSSGSPPLRISAPHLRLEFAYVGVSFAAPQRLRYQYMLEGFDHRWIDAGTRRRAYYTNIPPGSYRFRVRAAFGEAGLAALERTGGAAAGDSEADLEFVLLPRFYQTWLFWISVLALISALVLFVFRRRLMHVESEFRAVMAERSRIAREIHDTLAQGYVGISVQLEILDGLLRHNRRDAAANQLAVTKDLVREGLDDARQSIWALRSQDVNEHTLPVRLRRLVEKAQTDKLKTDFALHGAFRAMPSASEREILRIAQEAIQNVKRHSGAANLGVHLDYDDKGATLSISDDGKGFEPADIVSNDGYRKKHEATSNEKRHFGLVGMRERAALVGAELEIRSAAGEGTVIKLRVPMMELRVAEQRGEFHNHDET